jgi:signal transduction histidine kinase/phage shock protein PspC (stress-responsive transcriptional regulator)
MGARRPLWHDAEVSALPSISGRLDVPRSRDRVVAGVAGGWADHWGVEPTVVRAALGLLSLLGGLGVVLYGLGALASAPPLDPAATRVRARPRHRDRRRELAIATATGAVLVVARTTGLWPGDAIMVPAIAVAVGVAVAWTPRAAGESGRSSPRLRALQAVAGIALLLAGLGSLASRTGGLANVGASASAIAVVIGGLAMFAAPAIGRLLKSLDEERGLRIREDERAAVAAHLHDSVLQSLVLIQRSDDPRRMATLARRQERQLRRWLYGSAEPGEPTTVHAAVEALAAEIEADHDVRVEAVVVGDQPLDDAARTLVAALREAIINAARHADSSRIYVFVEVDDAELTGFVRDTGCGFDPDRIPEGRRGICDSIVGRLQRAGGAAVLTSKPGAGTEVELRLPKRRA